MVGIWVDDMLCRAWGLVVFSTERACRRIVVKLKSEMEIVGMQAITGLLRGVEGGPTDHAAEIAGVLRLSARVDRMVC